MAETNLVAPGERIATEEEFASGANTYVENGVIYASAFGSVVKANGSVSVESATKREVKMIDKGMLVIGTVTDDMRSVIFVRLDDIVVGRKEYLALKDGKIVADKRPGRSPMGRSGADNRFHEVREKTCGVGDTILAKVLYNDKDSYTLGLIGDEYGVVFAKCGKCGGEMDYDNRARMLECRECRTRDRRKVSALYGEYERIRALFA